MPTLTIKSEKIEKYYIELEAVNGCYRVRVGYLFGEQYSTIKEYSRADKKKAIATYNRYKREITKQ